MAVGNPSFLNLGSTRVVDVIDCNDGVCYKIDDMPSIGEILFSRGIACVLVVRV